MQLNSVKVRQRQLAEVVRTFHAFPHNSENEGLLVTPEVSESAQRARRILKLKMSIANGAFLPSSPGIAESIIRRAIAYRVL